MSTLKADALAPLAPLIVHSRGDIAGALIARRHALGWTGEDLDERAGWADRYAGKLERPLRRTGKAGFLFEFGTEVCPSGTLRASAMSQVWCEALGVRLVLVDAATAAAIGAVPAPPPTPGERLSPVGGSTAPAHAAKRLQEGKRSIMPLQAFEAADRTQVAALSFKVAVVDHAWLTDRPALRERAEDLARQLEAFADDIREAA